MASLVERFIIMQRETLKQAHNFRFTYEGYEFRLIYEGGLAESFSVLWRKIGDRNFRHFDGFSAYKLYDKEQVISFAKALVSQKLKDLI